MPDLDVNFGSDRAEGSWPIKLSGSEDEAQKMGEAPKETPLAERSRSRTKAVEEASRKRKRSSTTTEVQVEDVPETTNDIASLSFTKILALYDFAIFRDVPGLADVAVSVMLEKITTTSELPVRALEYLLEHIPERGDGEHCHMFAMLVEIAARYVSGADFCAYMNDILPEFLIAVLVRQRELETEIVDKLMPQQLPSQGRIHPRHGVPSLLTYNMQLARKFERIEQKLRDQQVVLIKACN
jgi:hypothetical protein